MDKHSTQAHTTGKLNRDFDLANSLIVQELEVEEFAISGGVRVPEQLLGLDGYTEVPGCYRKRPAPTKA